MRVFDVLNVSQTMLLSLGVLKTNAFKGSRINVPLLELGSNNVLCPTVAVVKCFARRLQKEESLCFHTGMTVATKQAFHLTDFAPSRTPSTFGWPSHGPMFSKFFFGEMASHMQPIRGFQLMLLWPRVTDVALVILITSPGMKIYASNFQQPWQPCSPHDRESVIIWIAPSVPFSSLHLSLLSRFFLFSYFRLVWVFYGSMLLGCIQ